MKTINEKQVEAVRETIWKLWQQTRDLRGKKKTLPIFGVEMALLELGMMANGMNGNGTWIRWVMGIGVTVILVIGGAALADIDSDVEDNEKRIDTLEKLFIQNTADHTLILHKIDEIRALLDETHSKD